MRPELPIGTVTFLFTDVERSTRLLHELGDERFADVLARHRGILRGVFSDHGGVEVDTQGDAFFVAFPNASGALLAAADCRTALLDEPIRVRMGIHTGTPLRTDEGYVGADVHRAARIAASGHGGQILVSAATVAEVDASSFDLVDLGDHRFKDLLAPERVYQLGMESFPEIRSLYQAHLPKPATSFVGRERELEEVTNLLRRHEERLLTLTGPGGTGKTRLALEAAAEAAEEFPDGLWWVPLSALTDASLVPSMIAGALEIGERPGSMLLASLGESLANERALILIDNAEHLLPQIAVDLSALLASAPGPTLLVTSRERLQIAAEHEYAVPSLDSEDAIKLFIARAAAVGIPLEPSDEVRTLCDRLDRLPLALQLAAPRLKLFSVGQLVERLSARFDLLKGGRDTDARQRTLRATIEWSHELLSDGERLLFRRLSVFSGGSSLGAPEEVCGADPDTFQGLVDKSLLLRRAGGDEPRFWMLESIRDFAGEHLIVANEVDAYRQRHGAFFQGLAEDAAAAIRAGEPEERWVKVLDDDIDNIRTAMDVATATGNVELVRRVTASLHMYWLMRDRYAEGRSCVERALSLSSAEDDTRVRLLLELAGIAYRQGDHEVAISASDEAAGLTMRLGGVSERFAHLKSRAFHAMDDGDLDGAEELLRLAMDAAIDVDNGVGISSCRLNLATIANERSQHEDADALYRENLIFVRSRGQSRCEAFTMAGLAETALLRSRAADAVRWGLDAAERTTHFGEESLEAYCLDLAAAGLAEQGESERAAIVLAATERKRDELGMALDDEEAAARERAFDRIRASLDTSSFERASAEGRAMSLDQAIALFAAERTDATAP